MGAIGSIGLLCYCVMCYWVTVVGVGGRCGPTLCAESAFEPSMHPCFSTLKHSDPGQEMKCQTFFVLSDLSLC